MAHTAAAVQSFNSLVSLHAAGRAVHRIIHPPIILIIISHAYKANTLVTFYIKSLVFAAGFLHILIPTYLPGKESSYLAHDYVRKLKG